VIPSRDHPVVFYCNGIRCGRSREAAQIARGCGFRNVYWFRGGFEEWLAQGYPYLKE
jgi:rhodanese-related sulfurtransferase